MADEGTFWKGQLERVKSAGEFRALCMDVWSRIDFVQAINTSSSQKVFILGEIMNSLQALHASCNPLVYEGYRNTAQAEVVESIELVESIKNGLRTTFSHCTGEDYAISLRLIDEMLQFFNSTN